MLNIDNREVAKFFLVEKSDSRSESDDDDDDDDDDNDDVVNWLKGLIRSEK